MRILLISNLYPPHYIGGYEIGCKFIADGLSQKGHNVFILTSKYGVGKKKIEDNIFRILNYVGDDGNNLFVRRYNHIRTAILGRLNYLITNNTIKLLKPDLVFVGNLLNISIFPVKAVQSRKVPIVYHLSDYSLEEFINDNISEKKPIKRFYRNTIYGFMKFNDFDFTHIITISEAVKKRFVRIGFLEENVSVIPLPRGFNPALIAKEGLQHSSSKDRKIKLLYVGRISEEKGIHIAIKSVENLVNQHRIGNLSLEIIGSGDINYNKYLYSLIESVDLTTFVKFKGPISYDEVLMKYRNYDMLLVPSIWEEPFGLIIVEAMSQGLPVIATKTGGIPEIIEDGKNGLLVPTGDSVRMAEAIKKLVDDPSLYEKISRNGIKRVQEEYTNEKIVGKINNYISNVFQQSKRKIN